MESPVTSLCFSPAGDFLITAHADMIGLCLWSVVCNNFEQKFKNILPIAELMISAYIFISNWISRSSKIIFSPKPFVTLSSAAAKFDGSTDI